MEAELASLQAALARVKKAKVLAQAQIETLLVEQKALLAKRDADIQQMRRTDEREAFVRAAQDAQAAVEAAAAVVASQPPLVPPSPQELGFLDEAVEEADELDELEDFLRNN
ncbi:Aste57867_15814 [Aphanomyces stellatus]|uniref:Aste57867_15814 protein n=1 Tax=Aphanomyces stellatus TaxID=120398 RepID=A0A485L4B1_9STRA|nr:hypothetical protein As57867_015758 [Aphanomyces stellatus]VFT92602.1 Aste57867_15814 [Aphanomyces stellatus]